MDEAVCNVRDYKFHDAEDNGRRLHRSKPGNFLLIFTDGEGDGAVGILLFDHPDQMDDAFICIISVFSTLQDKGTEAKVYPSLQQFRMSSSDRRYRCAFPLLFSYAAVETIIFYNSW